MWQRAFVCCSQIFLRFGTGGRALFLFVVLPNDIQRAGNAQRRIAAADHTKHHGQGKRRNGIEPVRQAHHIHHRNGGEGGDGGIQAPGKVLVNGNIHLLFIRHLRPEHPAVFTQAVVQHDGIVQRIPQNRQDHSNEAVVKRHTEDDEHKVHHQHVVDQRNDAGHTGRHTADLLKPDGYGKKQQDSRQQNGHHALGKEHGAHGRIYAAGFTQLHVGIGECCLQLIQQVALGLGIHRARTGKVQADLVHRVAAGRRLHIFVDGHFGAGAGDILLLDVTPLSLSIETMGGIATRLIERNTTIPTKKSQIFSTAADNQTAVDINVVQGERQFAKDNKSLGQFRLDGIPPAPRGVPQIEVTFDIDANGIVNVSAKDLGTGKEQHITITAGSNMSDDDIDKAVKEAAEFEAQDKKRKEAIDTRNEADAMVFQTEKAIQDVGDKLDAADKAAVEADVQALKDILAKSAPEETSEAQVAEIKAAKEKLMESAQKLFTKMYEQNAAAGAQAGPTPGAGPAPESSANDDVVDGDYKEV